jgi:predicted nucleic acid-binding Zn ribbon protein
MDQVADTEAPYSANWWKQRSSEQLQQMVRAGLAAGEHGAEAIRELERRAREHAAAQEHREELQVAHKEDRRLQILAVVLIALVIAVGVVLLIR